MQSRQINMLTFESIRELERSERDNKKLQRIPESFIAELKDYIARKEQLSSPDDVIEFQAVKGTIARLFEMRERKLIDSALITARTGLPPENLLPGEAQLFWTIVERLKSFREELFGKLKTDTQVQRKIMWRVVKNIDFVAPDMKEYKLKQGETLELPADTADILLKSGIVEEVR